jgi:2'-hydroxyisoflavone reductase
MRILLLGGTIFLGRHVVVEALARGHELTLYTRGLHGADLFPEAEHVRGDRADVAPLRGRAWDAAIDTSGYEPAQVEQSARLDVGHYVFVSSVNAYPAWPEEPVDEDSPVHESGDDYGALKVACERAGEAALPGRFATVRAGLLCGPFDNIFRLPWWVRRIARGGTVPAPGHPDRRMQLIDARDLAAFLVDLAEQRIAGAFNGTAPIGQTTFREVLEAAGDADLRWIPDAALQTANVEPWTELPLWIPGARAPGGSAPPAPRRPACAAARSPKRSPTSPPGCEPAARRNSPTGAPSCARRQWRPNASPSSSRSPDPYPAPRSGTGLVPQPVFKTGQPAQPAGG